MSRGADGGWPHPGGVGESEETWGARSGWRGGGWGWVKTAFREAFAADGNGLKPQAEHCRELGRVLRGVGVVRWVPKDHSGCL